MRWPLHNPLPVVPPAAAGLTFFNALFNFVVVAFHPAFRGTHAFDDPWAATATSSSTAASATAAAAAAAAAGKGSAPAGHEVLAFLAARPDLAAQAAGAVAHVAVQPGAVVAPNPLRQAAAGEDANPFK